MQLKMSDKIYKTMLFRNQKAITTKLWPLKEGKQCEPARPQLTAWKNFQTSAEGGLSGAQ